MYKVDGQTVIPYGRKNPGVAKLDFIQLEQLVSDLMGKIDDLDKRMKALEGGTPGDGDHVPRRGRPPKDEK